MCRGNLKDQVSPVGCREQYAQLYQPGSVYKQNTLTSAPVQLTTGYPTGGLTGVPALTTSFTDTNITTKTAFYYVTSP
jgi:hypothetical protein